MHFECERPEREIHNVQVGPPEIEGCRTVTLTTSRGDIECRDYAAPDSSRAAVRVGGAGGGCGKR